jgi:hypothetical protein
VTVSLDTVVSEVVYLAKTLEKAVHDQGPWTMTYAGRTVPAKRLEIESGVLFVATFTEHCHLVPPDPRITLDCNGEPVSVRAIVFPGDGAFEVQWSLRVEISVPVG